MSPSTLSLHPFPPPFPSTLSFPPSLPPFPSTLSLHPFPPFLPSTPPFLPSWHSLFITHTRLIARSTSLKIIMYFVSVIIFKCLKVAARSTSASKYIDFVHGEYGLFVLFLFIMGVASVFSRYLHRMRVLLMNYP